MAQRIRLGVAFGGGGTRGIAHLGVIRCLRAEGFRPKAIAGTSAGSIAGALYAADVEQEQIEEALHSFDWYRRVVDIRDSVRSIVTGDRTGIVSNRKLAATMKALVEGRSFDELPIDFAVTASDLDNARRVIITSKRVAGRLRMEPLEEYLPPPQHALPGIETVILDDVDVGLAVAASCAVPGIFHPVAIDGMRLYDGGVFDGIPVDVARAMRSRVVLGVSLGEPYLPRHVGGFGSTIAAQLALSAVTMHRRSLDEADVAFRVDGIDDANPRRAHQEWLEGIGEASMRSHVAELRRKVNPRPRRR